MPELVAAALDVSLPTFDDSSPAAFGTFEALMRVDVFRAPVASGFDVLGRCADLAAGFDAATLVCGADFAATSDVLAGAGAAAGAALSAMFDVRG